MLSVHRKRSLLLMLCALIAWLVMSGGTAVSAHTHVTVLSSPVAVTAASAVLDVHAAGAHGEWKPVSTGDDSAHAFVFVDDHDVDDELVVPLAPQLWLHYALSAAPLSLGDSPYSTPLASPLRPPRLA